MKGPELQDYSEQREAFCNLVDHGLRVIEVLGWPDAGLFEFGCWAAEYLQSEVLACGHVAYEAIGETPEGLLDVLATTCSIPSAGTMVSSPAAVMPGPIQVHAGAKARTGGGNINTSVLVCDARGCPVGRAGDIASRTNQLLDVLTKHEVPVGLVVSGLAADGTGICRPGRDVIGVVKRIAHVMGTCPEKQHAMVLMCSVESESHSTRIPGVRTIRLPRYVKTTELTQLGDWIHVVAEFGGVTHDKAANLIALRAGVVADGTSS